MFFSLVFSIAFNHTTKNGIDMPFVGVGQTGFIVSKPKNVISVVPDAPFPSKNSLFWSFLTSFVAFSPLISGISEKTVKR